MRIGGRLTINNGDALACAARDGPGIVLTPHFIVADLLASKELVEIPPRCRPAPVGIWAVYPAGRFPQPKLRVFIDHLSESLRRKGPEW